MMLMHAGANGRRWSKTLCASAVRWALACSLLAPSATALGQVRAEAVKDVNAPVQTGSKITFKNLLDAVFKGVKTTGSGQLVTTKEKVLRRIGEKDRTVLPEGTSITDIRALHVRGDGRRYIVLAITAEAQSADAADLPWGHAFVVADFPEGSAKPQDMADLQGDRFCEVDDRGIVLGPDDGFVIENTHHNSNQGYRITDLFHIHGGRLRRIDSVFTLTNRGSCEDSEELMSWKTEPDPDSPYPKVIATVTLEKKPSVELGPDCPKPKRVVTEVYSETYRWDRSADRYVLAKEGTGLQKLNKFNKENL